MRVVLLLVMAVTVQAGVYDPLAVPDGAAPKLIELTVPSDGRTVPLRVQVPPGKGPFPVVLFSHGLGGTNRGLEYLEQHWARRGYLTAFMQHPGSDWPRRLRKT